MGTLSSRQIRITSSRSIPVSFDSSSGVRWFAIVPPSRFPVQKSPPRSAQTGQGIQLLSAQGSEPHPLTLVAAKLISIHRIIDRGDGCDRDPPLPCPGLGVWRSLVARSVRVGEVPSSNLGTPILVSDTAVSDTY